MNNTEDKMVSHPAHYQSDKGIEVIDVIEAFTSELTGIEAFDTSNIIKYICRWKHKNGVQDLKKAKWYIEHLIDCLENTDSNENAYCDDKTIELSNREHTYLVDWETAWTLFTNMKNCLARYGNVSVADFYDFAKSARDNGKVNYLMSRIGWTDLGGTTITETDKGILLVMPEHKNLYEGE